jgi:type IV pilus assembly protein PilY1
MNVTRFLQGIGAAALVTVASAGSHAEDIDLFLGLPASAETAPNVLFVIDNTANWSSSGATTPTIWDAEKAALSTIFDNLENGAVNVGFLMYTETGSGNSNTDGAYIRSAIRNLNGVTKGLYADQIRSFDVIADKSNGGKAGLAMLEAYMYFSGSDAEAGNNKVKTDYFGNMSGGVSSGAGTIVVTDGIICGWQGNPKNNKPKTCTIPDPNAGTGTTSSPDNAVWALPGNALQSKAGPQYTSPVPPEYCGKNYIIFISNGAAQDNQSDINRGEGILGDAPLNGDTSQISLTPSGSQKNPADEWARFMADSPYAITTFTVDVDKVTTGQGPGWSALLQSMAFQSGGTYYDVASDVSGISDAVNDAFTKILGVNSVFASVALPASANTQSTFLNQVFIGQFRPDEDANPRWFGNLKQYKLGFDTSGGSKVLRLQDANENTAIDSGQNGSGFILDCARSFWTPGSVDTYWDYLAENDRRGGCKTVLVSDQSNFPDGPVVEKGGQAYVGRGGSSYASALASARNVKTTGFGTCGGGGTACTTSNFNVANLGITAASLGDSSADRTTYINWARGADTEDEDGDTDLDEYRPSLHGDVIHSQPIAIDYAGDPNDPAVIVFYGSNDGMLRAINGNRSEAHNGATTGTGTPAGGEFWAFLPPEAYSNVDRNFKNSPIVKFPASGATVGASGAPKPYGADGPLTAAQFGSARYLYMGMRRGGRSIYGFDVSSAGTPSLKFRLGCTTPLGDNGGCASGWNDVGQTWSPIRVTYVTGDNTPYLVMGGGYDTCEDVDDPNGPANNSCGSSTDGDKIYVLDGTTGTILTSFDTERAVPGGVTIVSIDDDDQNIAYAYATDTGGNVYRLSAAAGAAIGSTPPVSWVITKVADLGCGTKATDTCNANRKFLFGPDVIRVPDSSNLAVMVGSGDREKPIYGYEAARSVGNQFYAIFDNPTDSSWLTAENGNCGANTICPASLTAVDPNTPLASGVTVSAKGWRMALRSNEQVVSGALTVADTINFSTHIPGDPNEASCSNDLGTATTYNVNYTDGEGILNSILGGGLVPTPVAGIVVLDDGQKVPFCIGCGGENSAIGSGEITKGVNWTQGKSRVYWKIDK